MKLVANTIYLCYSTRLVFMMGPINTVVTRADDFGLKPDGRMAVCCGRLESS